MSQPLASQQPAMRRVSPIPRGATARPALPGGAFTRKGDVMEYEYKVIQLREGLIGGKMSDTKLGKALNEHAKGGWQLKAITAVDVKGRVGPGGVEGLLITFERPKA